MKKYTKITNGNIHLISFRIKQFINRMEVITMQSTYPVSIALQKLSSNPREYVCKSQVTYLSKDDYSMRFDTYHNNKIIVINFQKNSGGFILEVGMKIRFSGNRIYIKKKSSFSRPVGQPILETWKRGNKELCCEQTYWNKVQADDYYKECERELERDLLEM